jgi:FtsP/CotA-like multicopper oxidase with cupredoxin domain
MAMTLLSAVAPAVLPVAPLRVIAPKLAHAPPLPGPVLRMRQGSTVTLRVTNRLRVPTSIHWHGIVLPFDHGRRAGDQLRRHRAGREFVYRFTVRQSGTYWYHAHSRFQEQTGLYGAIVIEPDGGERIPPIATTW